MNKFGWIFLLLFVSPLRGELNKTYPTSPVTVLRVQAYQDAIQSIYDANYDLQYDTWSVIGSSYVYLSSDQIITGYLTDTSQSTWTVVSATWTLSGYNQMLINDLKIKAINTVADQEEIYMVWPDTSPPVGWKGWCLSLSNGNPIAGVCP